jgi:radical SAM superfamily enzyme YgiQ (UPF0313 family)
MEKKLILVYPPHIPDPSGLYGQGREWFPLGIASIAAYVGKEIQTVCLDLFNYTMENAKAEIIRELDENTINYVGFTLMTEQRHVVLDLIDDLKGPLLEDYNIKTIVGGPHASTMYNQLMENYPEIDYIVIGEGEKAVKYIITDPNPSRLVKIDEPIDIIPSSYDGIDYFKNLNLFDTAPIILSRGCTDHCTFCMTNKTFRKYRVRPADEVYKEIENYVKQEGIYKFKFHDDSATADKANLIALCRLLKTLSTFDGVTFEMTARADQLDEELIIELKHAGLVKIALGIESGSEKLRKAMNKKLDINKALENIRLLKAHGIHVHLLFIIGYPGETEETIEETRQFIIEAEPSSFSNLPGLMILPGTPIYNKLVREKWIDDRYWLKRSPPPYYTKEHSQSKLLAFSDIIRKKYKAKIVIMAVVNQDIEVFKAYLESLKDLEIPPYIEVSWMFALHNSPELAKLLPEGSYYEVNNRLSHDFSHTWDYDKFAFIADEKNKLVNIAKEAKADYIFWVDSDLILHPKTLTQLFHSGAPIVSTVFWTKWPACDQEMPNCWDADHYSFNGGDFERYRKPGFYQVGGTGAAILVYVGIYDRNVNYTPIPNVSYSVWEDRAFCIRAAAKGLPIYCDTLYPATHLYTKELYDLWYNNNKRGEKV